ncbi:MAG: hypothetical protein KF763_15090 [Cyclobacteriaceae bacterium]|nr:hypothetical protein [Cyclobacteriaceae bacterium]
MKKILIVWCAAIVFTACTDFDLEDQTIKVIQLPGYVAFANTGGTIAAINRTVAETSTTAQNLRIEVATGSLSDVTVTYSFSGTAVLGTDFTVTTPGGTATATGGTIVIRRNQTPAGTTDFDFVNLGIRAVADGVDDGDKSLTITLVSATNADGKMFAVGRGAPGSTIYLRSASVNFTDVD